MEVYAIRHWPSQRIVYIGFTTKTAAQRFHQHVMASRAKSPRQPLAKVMKEYGPDNFEHEVLAHVNSRAEGFIMEAQAIASNGTLLSHGGYNIAYPGDGGYHHTDEARKKIGAASKGHPGAMKGKHHTDEAKAKLSEQNFGAFHPQFGKPKSEETKAKLRQANTGRVITEETRAKLRAAKVGVPKSESHRQALSAAKMGKQFSEEHKQKLREASQRRWHPERFE